jgi:hypothetical protein
MSNKQEQAPIVEQIQEQAPIVEQAPEVQELPKGKQPKGKPVDLVTYKKYTDLKFIALSGAKLTDAAKKELAELEKEVKACSGKVAKRTVRAAIMNEQVLLVEGMPMPAEVLEIIGKCKTPNYYA